MTDAEKAALAAAERKRSSEILKACRAANLSADYAQELIDSERTLENSLAEIEKKKNAPAPVNESEVRKNATAEERTRISEIRKAGQAVRLDETFIQTLVDADITLDEARAKIIDEAARKNPVSPAPHLGASAGADEKDKKQRGMESCILERANVMPADKIGDPAEYKRMTLLDIAKECLRNANIDFRGLTQREIATEALRMNSRGGGGLATGDFSYVLANVLNKTLRAMYDLQEKTFPAWTRKSTAQDFKPMLRAQLNDVKLAQVQEGGEYQLVQLGDSGETYKVGKWGRIVNINWEAIVNDDLNAFTRIPQFLSAAVSQMQSDMIYGILTGSHLMGDGNQLFDASNHLNYTSTGTALSVASLGVARQMLRDQKSPGGNVLNIIPKYLIVGSQNEAAALQFTSSNYVATKQSDVNVWTGMLTPIVDGRISGKQWFLTGNPNAIDTVEYATLEGEEIYSETKYGWSVDSLQWKVRSVFGAKAIEWRSMYKNAGA